MLPKLDLIFLKTFLFISTQPVLDSITPKGFGTERLETLRWSLLPASLSALAQKPQLFLRNTFKISKARNLQEQGPIK
jgi:hypothetical protein